MRKILTTASLIVFLSIHVLPVSAATVRGGEEFRLLQSEEIRNDLYVSGENLVFEGSVFGDSIIAGGTVILNGPVTEDVLGVGGSIHLFGGVGDDVRLAGGQIIVGSTVSGDVAVAGGLLQVLPEAMIMGDALLAGGRVVIDGTINGNASIYGGDVLINGIISGKLTIYASDKVEFGENSVLRGPIIYTAPKEAVISPLAKLSEDVTYNEASLITDVRSYTDAIFGAVFITKIFTLLTSALLIGLIFQKFATSLATGAVGHPGSQLLRGLIVLILFPIVSLIALISLLGTLLGLIGIVLIILAFMLVKVMTGVMFGALLARIIQKKVLVSWQWIIIGTVLLQAISLLPFIGFIITTAIFLITLGSLSQISHISFWKNR